MIRSLSEAFTRKSGHCVVHSLFGTLTSQYGRSVFAGESISSGGIFFYFLCMKFYSMCGSALNRNEILKKKMNVGRSPVPRKKNIE